VTKISNRCAPPHDLTCPRWTVPRPARVRPQEAKLVDPDAKDADVVAAPEALARIGRP
jgi:hypothetical protein